MNETELRGRLKTLTSKQRRYDIYFLKRCFEAANMSYCLRLKVGAVAVKDNRTILDGWNGTIHGQGNCCEEECPICHGTGFSSDMTKQFTCSRCGTDGYITKESTIHAERNIVFYAAKKGISLEGATMYITHNPCMGCAQAMAAAGIVRVVYAENYRTDDGIKFLKQCNIQVEKVEI